MDQINNIELKDPEIYPGPEVLESILGNAYSAFKDLLKIFENHQLIAEWRYYKDGKAWLCKVQYKKNTIIWMSAWKGFMKATVYIPEKELESVMQMDISETEKEIIRNTKNVGKSRPCMFEIRTRDVFQDLVKVMEYKIAKRK